MKLIDFIKKPIVIIALVVALILGGLMAVSYATGGNMMLMQNVVGTVFSPIRGAGMAVKNFFTHNFDRLAHYDDLVEENKQLKEQLAQTQYQLREYEWLKTENDELKNYLGIKDNHDDFDFTYANITGRGAGNSDKVLIVDVGTRSGVEVGQMAVTSDGVVGVITNAGRTFAEITTLLDTDTSIGAMVVRTHDVGVVEGSARYQNDGRCVLGLLPNENSAQIQDLVQTSGVGHNYPKGLLIGTVSDVYKDDYDASYTAVVKPAVDFDSVTSVMIITSFGDTEE